MADVVDIVAESIEVTKSCCMENSKVDVIIGKENGEQHGETVVNGNGVDKPVENGSTDVTVTAVKRKPDESIEVNDEEQAKKVKVDDTPDAAGDEASTKATAASEETTPVETPEKTSVAAVETTDNTTEPPPTTQESVAVAETKTKTDV